MKKVSDLAAELEVSKVTIHKHLKRLSLTTNENLTETVGNTKLINELGERLISEAVQQGKTLNKNSANENLTEVDASTNDNNIMSTTIEALREQLKENAKELEARRNEIEQLHRLLDQQQQLLRVEQQRQLTAPIEHKKKWWPW